jgi:nitrite reductase/ring-hydroxylating ferredoxin subunit
MGLIGVLEILWQTIAFQEESVIDRPHAQQRCMAYLRSVFPDRFGARADVSASTPQLAPPGWQATPAVAAGAALPAWAYASSALLARERAELLRPAWQLIGHEAEIQGAGDFLARDLGGERALVVRDTDGRLQAFRNACPHRPHALLAAGHGHLAGPLRCATHQLTFGWDGVLAQGEGSSLTPLELFQRGPLLFVRGARRAVGDRPQDPLEELPESGAPAGVHELDVAADWKLLVEQWLDAAPGQGTFLAPNQLLQQTGDGLQILQVIPQGAGRCRLRAFRYALPGRRTASGAWPGHVLQMDIAQVESTQLGIAVAGEDPEPAAPVAPRLAAFRRTIRAMLSETASSHG